MVNRRRGSSLLAQADLAVGRMPLAGSFEEAARARQVDAIAATADSVIASDRLIDGEYPLYAEGGRGAYVRDVDGNSFLDFICAYGTIILGHADARVDDAVVREIRAGFAPSMLKSTQTRLAKKLTEHIPGAELALLMKTGSDATGAAVRLARAYTGRNVVIRWGYNGWHDWCAIRIGGIPEETRRLTDTFEFNDIDSVERAFARHAGDVAAVVMMPFETELPQHGFLNEVREIAHRHGALFVLDEIRTGFRVGLGGAQQAFGVAADLVTLGKAMANGYPISALAGRRDVMLRFGDVHISSTYFANSLEMAASLATIEALETTDALPHIPRLGERLQAGLRTIVLESGLPAQVCGVPQMPFLRFAPGAESVKDRFYTETIRAGVLFHPNHHWYVSAAMTSNDIEHALLASSSAAELAVGGTTTTAG